MKPVGRGTVYTRRPFGRFPLGFAPVLVVLGFVALASSGPYFPLIPLFFVFVFFVAPALGRAVSSGATEPREIPEARPDPDSREKELLRVLERHEQVTAARAALETSLSIAEAEGMLAKLASGGHLEVHARNGTLAYALRMVDRRKARPKELEDAEHGPPE